MPIGEGVGSEGQCEPGVSRDLAVQRRSHRHRCRGFSTAKKLVIASWNTAGEKLKKKKPYPVTATET